MPTPNYRQLHETGIMDVLDKVATNFIFGKQDYDKNGNVIFDFDKRSKRVKTYSSIAKATSGMILVFPVVCTRAISAETASMVSKAVERKCVTMMQMLFSAYQVSNVSDVQAFIDQFHNNIKINKRYTIDDFISAMDKLSEGFDVIVDKVALDAIREDMKNLDFYFEEDLDNSSYGKYNVNKKGSLTEGSVDWSKYDPNSPNAKKWLPDGVQPGSNDAKDWAAAIADLENADTAKKKADAEARIAELKERLDEEKNNREEEKFGLEKINLKQQYVKNMLLDNDIKKANEVIPSTLAVSFYTTDDKGNPVQVESVVIGVKAKLVGVESQDTINHLSQKHEDGNWLLQLIKATTRETSFVRDFLFAVDKAKIDTIGASKAGSANPMWKVLEQRANKLKRRKITRGGNDASAISTLVLSKQAEVDVLLNDYDIDLMNPRIMGPLMNGYNFMGVIVVDELLEVVHIMWDDGDDSWEDLSFNVLSREASSNDMKKVINLMSKVR